MDQLNREIKVIHISDVKYISPTDRIIEKFLDWQLFARQSKLRYIFKMLPV